MLVLQIVAARFIYELLMTLLSLTPWYWRLVKKITNSKMKSWFDVDDDEEDPEYTVPD